MLGLQKSRQHGQVTRFCPGRVGVRVRVDHAVLARKVVKRGHVLRREVVVPPRVDTDKDYVGWLWRFLFRRIQADAQKNKHGERYYNNLEDSHSEGIFLR